MSLPLPPAGLFEGVTPIKMMIAQVHEPLANAWVTRRRDDLIDQFASSLGGLRVDDRHFNFAVEHAAELTALAELADHRTRGMLLSRQDANALAALQASAAVARSTLGLSEAPPA